MVGAKKFGSFSLGAVTGTRLAGILIGQIGIEISGQVKSIFFIHVPLRRGLRCGPQFVRGIATDGAPQAAFAVVVSVLPSGVYIAAVVSGYGTGPGSRSPRRIADDLGLHRPCDRRDQHLWPHADQAKAELDLIPVAYAITYLFGTVGTAGFGLLRTQVLGVDLAAECARYEREMSVGASESGL